MREMLISQTALNRFIDCPYQYKLSYVNGKEGIYYNQDALDIGKHTHKAIELMYKRHYTIDMLNPETILYYSYDNLKNIWDTTLSTEAYKKAYLCLYNHSQWQATYPLGIDPIVEPHIIEESDDDYKWHGYIDFIDKPKLKVIDWKTNTKAVLSKQYRYQAEVYRALFKSKYGIDLPYFYFYFLYPNEWRTVSFEKESQKKVAVEMKKEKARFINAIEDSDFPKQPRTKNMCKNCAYRFYCKVLEIE